MSRRYQLRAETSDFLATVAFQVTGVDPRPLSGTDERGPYLDLTSTAYLKAILVAAIERRRAESPGDQHVSH